MSGLFCQTLSLKKTALVAGIFLTNFGRSLYDCVQMCLSRPNLAEKCRELTRVLVNGPGMAHHQSTGLWNAPLKDVHAAFNLLMSDVFGYPAGGTANGWNICAITLSKQVCHLHHSYFFTCLIFWLDLLISRIRRPCGHRSRFWPWCGHRSINRISIIVSNMHGNPLEGNEFSAIYYSNTLAASCCVSSPIPALQICLLNA